MKTKLSILTLFVLLSATPGLVGAGDAQTLTGSFRWDQGGSEGDLEAIFTPAGDGKWEVSFYFDFRGQPHVYTGTAEGSLGEGKLKGRVLNDDKKRSFTFEGSFEDGTFRGSHAETTAGREKKTGTLKLAA